jgi:hypothetical protein
MGRLGGVGHGQVEEGNRQYIGPARLALQLREKVYRKKWDAL